MYLFIIAWNFVCIYWHLRRLRARNNHASIKESIKREIFIKEVVVRPRKFEWEGHAVKLGECWLERNVPSGKLPFICFSFGG